MAESSLPSSFTICFGIACSLHSTIHCQCRYNKLISIPYLNINLKQSFVSNSFRSSSHKELAECQQSRSTPTLLCCSKRAWSISNDVNAILNYQVEPILLAAHHFKTQRLQEEQSPNYLALGTTCVLILLLLNLE